jgi:choline dehydrogenase-like flavoprotein
MSDFEFKAGRDGLGPEWPISASDLSPYYANLESFFRVCGARDGLEQLPDGNYLDPSPFSPAEVVFKNRVEQRLGRPVIISRGIRARRAAENGDAYSRLSSPMTSLAAARATGNLTVRPDSIVAAIKTHKATGRATGVEYVDRVTRKLHHIHARVVVLCASTIESLRILMLSRSTAHPQGIGARSGLLGRGLMDHIVSNVYFYLPDVNESSGYELLGSDSIIVPRYRNLRDEEADFRRGYGFWGGISRVLSPLRRRKGIALGFLSGMGETLADDANTVTLNSSVKDAWGLPVAHIACKWTENDLRVASAMRADAEEMVAAAGGELTTVTDAVHTPFIGKFAKMMQKQWELTVPGLFVHEVGGACMGTHPNMSVTNQFCQIWETPNVLVADGACWPSSGWQNPTLTQMAVAARACDHAVSELKAGNL